MSDEQQIEPNARVSIAQRLRALAASVANGIRRAAAPLNRFRRILVLGGCGLFALASALAAYLYVQSAREQTLREGLTVDAALQQLDEGEYEEARRLAKLLPRANDLGHEELGEVHFVIGAAIAHETDNAWNEPDRAKLYALAARHLQEARQRTFPAGRENAGRLLLARCLTKSNDYEAALAPLLEVDDNSPVVRMEANHLLAIAYLKSKTPQLDKAAEFSAKYAQAADAMPEYRDKAALLTGEIALARGELEACDAALATISDDSDVVNKRQLMRGRLLITRADLAAASADGDQQQRKQEADQLYGESIELFRQALSHHASGQNLSSQASYLIGVVLRHQGQLEAAQDQFFRTRKRFYNTPEGIAASLEEAELLLQLGRLEEASEALQRTAEHVTSPGDFANAYISEKDLRERIEKGFQILYDRQRFDLAANLAAELAPLVGKASAAQLRAETLHRWGEHLHALARGKSGDEAEELARQGRKKYRLAGYAFADLAHQNYVTREFPTDLWHSGNNFNLGRDFQNAVIVLNEYLETEAQTERPLVLIALTQAYLSLNQTEEALSAIEDCVRDFPRDPAIYQARLLASRAYVESGNLQRAKALLEANLHHGALTPRSDAWRDSLFALGMLLHDEGRITMLQQNRELSSDPAARQLQHLEHGHELLHDAARKLSEAVTRYPNAQQATGARYALGESYRYGSRMPLTRYGLETIESRRAALNRQIQDELTAALDQYDQLVALLNEKSHSGNPLSAEEQKILRNVYFARGTVLYDLGDYEAAIKAYSTATSRYQHEPAALEAYVQIAACYRRLNKPLEARGTLEQAKLVMERIAADSDFLTTTRYGREEWTDLLNWLSSL